MSRRRSVSDISLQELLDSAKVLPRQPEPVRQRVLARARAAATTFQAPQSFEASHSPSAAPRLARSVVAPAAAAALAVGLAGAVYALSGRWSRHEVPDRTVSAPTDSGAVAQRPAMAIAPSATAVPPPTAAPVLSAPDATAAPATGAPPPRTRRQVDAQQYAAELALMRSAHTAYASHEFANGLVLVGEHARRFPAGLLAEEREALRVRCLLGSGRTSEAQRAAAAFAKRFPRSVLLARLQSEVGTSP